MPFCKGVDVIRKGCRGNRSSKNFVEAVLHLKDNLDNFTRRRNRKSKTPAELAGISLDLGRNRTLGLIYILGLLSLEEFIESILQYLFELNKYTEKLSLNTNCT